MFVSMCVSGSLDGSATVGHLALLPPHPCRPEVFFSALQFQDAASTNS